MTIDIRATVTCSLGTLISASISDDYVQGTGLIKCKGTCEISGIITPAIGTVVTFNYTQNGITTQVPRTLRVLSSFADPFRRTTSVSLGCKLTYLENKKDAINWRIYDDSNYPIQVAQEEEKIVVFPIYASSIMAKCLTELGITASSNPLTNAFSIYQFDLGVGYVSVLSDLLVSESYAGYLDANEVLQVFSLDVDGGTGPVIDSSKLIDISAINVGQLPGEAVTVSYSSLKLNKDTNQTDTGKFDATNESTAYQVSIPYKLNNVQYFQTYNVTSSSSTYTNYTDIVKPSGEKVRVVESRRTIKQDPSVIIEGSLVVDYLQNGLSYFNVPLTLDTSEFFYYDKYGNEYLQITETLGTAAHLGGSLNVSQWVFKEGGYIYVAGLGHNPTIVQDKIVKGTYTANNVQMVITETYGHYIKTIAGQQAMAFAGSELSTYAEVQAYLARFLTNGLGLINTNVTTQRLSDGQVGPDTTASPLATNADGGDPNNGYRTDSKAQLVLALGSATAQLRIEFSLPYAPDDRFYRTGAPGSYIYGSIPSDAPEKARRYGRAQNRLLLGNRSGMNVQTEAALMPSAPFAPFIVQANGLSALYRTNGTSWQMDANGILVSTDALFWGAVGGTGTFWFPVAPGITTLPTTPPVVNGQMTVASVVPVANETVVLYGTTRTALDVQSFGYALSLLTPVTVTTRTQLTAITLVAVSAPVSIVAVSGVAPVVAVDNAVAMPNASIAITALAPAVVLSTVVQAPLSTVALAALVPSQAGANSAVISIPLTAIAIAALTPDGVGADLETYYNSYRLQVFGWDAGVYPDWWAD